MSVIDEQGKVFPTEISEFKIANDEKIDTESKIDEKQTRKSNVKFTSHSKKSSNEYELYEEYNENKSPQQDKQEIPKPNFDETRNLRTAKSNKSSNVSPFLLRQKPKMTISKPSTTNLPNRAYSSLAQQKQIPQNLLKSPYVQRKYNVYVREQVKPNPPKAADPTFYKKKPVELGKLATALLNGKKLIDLIRQHNQNFDENGTHDGKNEIEVSEESIKEAGRQLKQLELELIDKAKYMQAKRAAQAYDQTESYFNRVKAVSTAISARESIKASISKKNELVAYITLLNENIKTQMYENYETYKKKLKELEEQHELELAQFDENVPTELTKEFNHETQEYHELRVKQRKLALNRDFDGALRVKQQADNLQEIQTQGNLKKMKKFYKKKRKEIEQRHTLQIQCLTESYKQRENEIKQSRKREVDGAKARIAGIDSEIKSKCELNEIDLRDFDLEEVDDDRVDLLYSRSKDTRLSTVRAKSTIHTFSPLRSPQRSQLPSIASPYRSPLRMRV